MRWFLLLLALTASPGKRTVTDVLTQYGPGASERLRPHLEKAGMSAPPSELTLVALKEERQLEVWGRHGSAWRWIRTYPITAASGGPGPKLREGDHQVPEGLYRINWLHPNSDLHLSMKVNYPNAFDRRQAASDGRTRLGGDIFIHGRAVSIGCIAIGDDAIEELFVLVARAGVKRTRVLIAPRDLRRSPAPRAGPKWMTEVYTALAREMLSFKR
jgi:murein L,D-transpeptidase YafK